MTGPKMAYFGPKKACQRSKVFFFKQTNIQTLTSLNSLKSLNSRKLDRDINSGIVGCKLKIGTIWISGSLLAPAAAIGRQSGYPLKYQS